MLHLDYRDSYTRRYYQPWPITQYVPRPLALRLSNALVRLALWILRASIRVLVRS